MHTVAEVAAILRVSDPTVRRLISSGELEAVKKDGGRLVRITNEALNAYLAKGWTPVAPREPEPEAATP